MTGWGVTSDGVKFWQARNSWGTFWGELGFFKIQRGENLVGGVRVCTVGGVDRGTPSPATFFFVAHKRKGRSPLTPQSYRYVRDGSRGARTRDAGERMCCVPLPFVLFQVGPPPKDACNDADEGFPAPSHATSATPQHQAIQENLPLNENDGENTNHVFSRLE